MCRLSTEQHDTMSLCGKGGRLRMKFVGKPWSATEPRVPINIPQALLLARFTRDYFDGGIWKQTIVASRPRFLEECKEAYFNLSTKPVLASRP